MFDTDEDDLTTALYEELSKIEQDGYIIIATRELMYNGITESYDESPAQVKYMFQDTEGMVDSESGLTVRLRRDSNGVRRLITYPWNKIQEVVRVTNSTAAAARVQEVFDEYNKKRYARDGIKTLEHVLGDHVAAPTERGYPVGQFDPNPCDSSHSAAVLTSADIWVCLDCATKWTEEGEILG